MRKIGKASEPVKAFVRARCAERAGSEEKAADKKRGAGDKRPRVSVVAAVGALLREYNGVGHCVCGLQSVLGRARCGCDFRCAIRNILAGNAS